MGQHLQIPIVIPAYKPGPQLVTLIKTLTHLGFSSIVVVDDGSGAVFAPIFHELSLSPSVFVAKHAVNLGKGAALKTGINHVLVHLPSSCGLVTADADGQHDPEDILAVAKALIANPQALILGARAFSGGAPWRSRIGNDLTRLVLRAVVGERLKDTQTGLRGIPSDFAAALLKAPSSGYEFELDMLLACKHQSRSIVEVPVKMIYVDHNKSSHFHPLLDSMRIYFLLLRFSTLSLVTALLDNIVFAIAFRASGAIAYSQVLARFVAMVFNYAGARTTVFHSRQRHAEVLPKYVTLVCVNGLLSYAVIQYLHSRFGVQVIYAKVLAECVLFLANFTLQRDIVFTRRKTASATDWDRYYQAVPVTARVTRKYTTSVLLDIMKRYCSSDAGRRPAIVELGGANSCFLDAILSKIRPARYHIVDNNRYGLSLLASRAQVSGQVHLCERDVLNLDMEMEADVVFSVGLVEHFEPEFTRKAVLAHFDVLKPGGIAVITFPTPTYLYRIARRALEVLGLWKFPDERPLQGQEVVSAVVERAEVLAQKTMWPLILTQQLVVARKRPTSFGRCS